MLLFFFNDTATTEIYTLSLHDALPISLARSRAPVARISIGFSWSSAAIGVSGLPNTLATCRGAARIASHDRKSTRLNSRHANIFYSLFCLKKQLILDNRKPLYHFPRHV